MLQGTGTPMFEIRKDSLKALWLNKERYFVFQYFTVKKDEESKNGLVVDKEEIKQSALERKRNEILESEIETVDKAWKPGVVPFGR